MKVIWKALVALALYLALAAHARADIKLPGLFTNGAVLQRDRPVPVWGWADPDEVVTVTIDKEQHKTTATAAGKWQVKLSPRPAGGPYTLTIAGKNTIALADVLFGEVWLCAGQSNMAWVVANSRDGKQAIAESTNPSLRLFVHSELPTPAEEPASACAGAWAAANPKTTIRASAVAYFFGRQLQQDLQVPVGLIYYACGASVIESWTSRVGLEKDEEDFGPIIEGNKQKVKDYPRRLEEYKAKLAEAATRPNQPPLRAPRNPNGANAPFTLFNGMIHPLIPYALRGVVWYQGESNTDRSEQYRRLLPALIRDWRTHWGQGDFPFLIVQIPNFDNNKGWAELREAQLFTAQRVANTGLVVTIDIGEAHQPHPANKREVGYRLSLLARALVYGQKLVYSGPIYESMKIQTDKVRLTFTHIGSGLVAKDGPLSHLEISGEDRQFVPATAVIAGDTVVVSSAKVARPVAVRYAWSDNPEGCNLFNKEGLPASPFRTDNWPGITTGKK